MSKRAANPQRIQLLFDIDEAARILSLTVDAVDRLCQMGELTPSITVGNSRLFSLRDLRRFTDSDEPRRISLNAGVRDRVLA